MAPSAGLLQWIMSRQNTLAAVKPAVPSLMNLKQSVQGVPFQLLRPGMGGVMSAANIMSGLQGMIGQLGGLGAIPGLQSILGQITKGTASLSQLQNALGGGAFAAAMASFAPPSPAQQQQNSPAQNQNVSEAGAVPTTTA